MFNTLDEEIQIQPFDPLQVHEGNTSLARAIENVRRDSANSRTKVMSFLDSQIADLKSGRFWSDFFRANNVGPLAQRYFLVKLKREGFLTPFEDPADGLFLQELKENAFDLDRDHVTREFADLEKRLRETSKKGFFGSIMSRENKEFDQVRRKTQDWFTQVAAGQRVFQKASFWQRYHEELQRAVEVRLNQFRAVSAVSDEVARNVAQEAERLRADPAAARGDASDAGAYYLDSEVMRDDRAGQRLWHRLFAHKLDKSAYYDEAKIFEAITGAFAPAVGDDGRVRAKDAMEIVRDLRDRLEAQAKDTFGRVFAEMGFDLRTALELEARYVATPGAKPSDDAAVQSVGVREVQTHMADKLRRVVDTCVILAAIDKTKRDDPTVVPADVFYVGCSAKYAGDAPTSLRPLIRGAATGVDFIDGWGEDDMIVFYRALLGVPIYFFRRVNEELYQSYKQVKAKPNRSYPLHIEAAWEDGIPNLDPKEMREAEDRRRAEEAAKREAGDRDSKIWRFVLATMAGSVQRNGEGGYDWVMGSIKKKLGGDRAGSYQAFWALDPSLRDDLVDAGAKLEREKLATAPGRRTFRGELESYAAGLKEAFAAAYADENEGAVRYLKEEKRVVEDKLGGLPSA
jgi:antitoxin component of RelBE/YafQ-DinJ toxin-antitoxin module